MGRNRKFILERAPMDIGRTHVSELIGTMQHEKAKYISLFMKLKQLLNVGVGYKLILSSIGKLILTKSPSEIYRNISYLHPVFNILKEYIDRLESSEEASVFFIEVLRILIECSSILLENGMSSRIISDTLYEFIPKIEDEFKGGRKNKCIINGNICESMTRYIEREIGNPWISDLVVKSVEMVGGILQDKIRVLKVPTGSVRDSYLVEGVVINRRPEGKISQLHETSIGVFNAPLDILRPELKGTVLIHTAEELVKYSKDEVEQIRKMANEINTNVVVINGNVNKQFLEFLDSRNIMVVRVFNKYDLKRICDNSGGYVYNRLGAIKHYGRIRESSMFEDSGFTFTKIIGMGRVATIILKNNVRALIDDMEGKINRVLEHLGKAIDYEESKDLSDSVRRIRKSLGDTDSIERNLIVDAIVSSVGKLSNRVLLLEDRSKCLRYAFETIAAILEIDDYLVARPDKLDIKPPKPEGHWDND